ncbi:MAG: MBL fold metallo-hydrolase [Acidobacteria bacterium]|nr:MBL fold metallo-hydrolase [Acidobacteriota bacterium]
MSSMLALLGPLVLVASTGASVQPNVRLTELSPDVAVVFDARVADATLTAIRTGEGLIVVDALSSPEAGESAQALLESWSDEPVRFLILTHGHGDHVWGAQSFSAARRMASGATARMIPDDLRSWSATQREQLESIEARLEDTRDHEESTRLEARRAVVVQDLDIMSRVDIGATLPHDIVQGNERIDLGRHTAIVLLFPIGHTAGDVAVHVPGADLLVTGDLVFGGQLPFISGTEAGAVEPLIEIHRQLLSLTGEGTTVVSGHRAPGGPELIRDRLGYLVALRDAVLDQRAQGATLQQAKAAILLPAFRHLRQFERFHPSNIERVWELQPAPRDGVQERYPEATPDGRMPSPYVSSRSVKAASSAAVRAVRLRPVRAASASPRRHEPPVANSRSSKCLRITPPVHCVGGGSSKQSSKRTTSFYGWAIGFGRAGRSAVPADATISTPFQSYRCTNQEWDPMKDIPGIDEDGKPKNGPFKLYFKNGLVSCEGEFENGRKSGRWKYFLNNGQMQSSGRFKDGKIVGRWKWFFKTGEPRGTGGFDDEEQKHGLWKRFHSNGQLWDEGRFEHGKKRGTWKVYDEAGELLKTQSFK